MRASEGSAPPCVVAGHRPSDAARVLPPLPLKPRGSGDPTGLIAKILKLLDSRSSSLRCTSRDPGSPASSFSEADARSDAVTIARTGQAVAVEGLLEQGAAALELLATPSAGSRPPRVASSRAVEPHTSLRVDGSYILVLGPSKPLKPHGGGGG